MPSRWTTHARSHEHTTPIFEVTTVERSNPANGHRGEYVVIESPDWVNVVALTTEGAVVLVRQYRHGTDDVTLEIPGGMVDPGESSVAAAMRELVEETGFGPAPDSQLAPSVIHRVHPNPAFMTNACVTVLVPGCRAIAPPSPDPGEDIGVVLASRADVARWVMDGTITHSLALNGIFAWLWSTRGDASELG